MPIMTVSVVTADDVLALAKSIKSLSEDQMTRIQDLLAFMDEEDLKMLKEMLEKLEAAEITAMKEEIEIRENFMAQAKGERASEVKAQLNAKSEASKKEDAALAESMIKNI